MLCLSAAQSISLQLPLLQCYQCVYELPLPEKVEREREREKEIEIERFDLFLQPFDQEYLHRSIIDKSTLCRKNTLYYNFFKIFECCSF